jgi:hypothetical protein
MGIFFYAVCAILITVIIAMACVNFVRDQVDRGASGSNPSEW